MQSIGELFAKRIDRNIEEVIKVEQSNESVVKSEIEEYVVTDAIREHFLTLYKAFADSASEPHEGIGVWLSGFFGSGKSSFAKILGYTLANKKLGDTTASTLFKPKASNNKLDALLDLINLQIPTAAVIFDVSMDRGVRSANRISEIMYKALLRTLDYADDFDLAELEITLEGDGKLEEFQKKFEEIYKQPWDKRRKVGMGLNEASRTLHVLDPKTFPNEDSWVRSIGRADITANLLAQRAFDLMARRRPRNALIFVIDEVGQWVSLSVDRMLDLMGVVQAFGMEGKNRVSARKAVAPAWIFVTAQEKLNEVVTALDSKKVELARLQDRFRWAIDLKQTDISQVTKERVLEKTEPARKLLAKIYKDNEPRLKEYCALERTGRSVPITQADFVGLYPYLPYQIELSIDIVSGLRSKRGTFQHVGGSNRTIIKQAQQMMIHDRTHLAKEPVGTLVTMDKVYELLYAGNLLPTEVTREVESVSAQLRGNEMALKVAKAISLLEDVTRLPRTPHNIAVVLQPTVDADFVKPAVEKALQDLEKAQFVRETDDGYKLLTAQEKNWEKERNGLEPKPADRNRILRTLLREIFQDPKLRSYRYMGLRTFRVSLFLEGVPIDDEGEIEFNVFPAEGAEDRSQRTAEARTDSNSSRERIFWVTDFGDEIGGQIVELYRSQQMVETRSLVAAQKALPAEEQAALAQEKIRQDRIHRGLRDLMAKALAAGTGYFQGVEKDGSSLGKSLPEIVGNLLDSVVPSLYPKLEMGVRQISGDEPETFLTAANLNGLPPIFYSDGDGLNLVISQSGKYVPNVAAQICREVLEYLRREYSYGNKITGKFLETHFNTPPYGWERDVLRLVMAVLLRGGGIEVTHQGRKYRTHTEPASRIPFTNNNAFRAASFAPRESLDLKILGEAVRKYEALTGKEVDVEESAIAQAFQKLASDDRERLLPLVARMTALKLPGADWTAEQLQYVEGILSMPSDDCVKTLSGEGETYKEARGRISRLEQATTEPNLALVGKARRVLESVWPVLKAEGADAETAKMAERLERALTSERFYDDLSAIRDAADGLAQKYEALYAGVHQERAEVFSEALDSVRGMPEWSIVAQNASLPEETRRAVLSPLSSRVCELHVSEDSEVCLNCRASVSQMQAEIEAVDGIRSQVAQKVRELAMPEERIERVRVGSLVGGRLENEKDIEEALKVLREHLVKLLASGAKVVLE